MCPSCVGVLLDRVQFREIVQRTIVAEAGWALVELEWAEIYQKLRGEVARARAESHGAGMTGVLVGLLDP
jgi:Zn-finger nucleic acid-binding protein